MDNAYTDRLPGLHVLAAPAVGAGRTARWLCSGDHGLVRVPSVPPSSDEVSGPVSDWAGWLLSHPAGCRGDWLGGVPLPAALSYDAPLDAYLARHPDRLLNPSPAAGDEDGDDCGAMRSMVCMRGAQKIVLGRGGCIG
jgi:hypothetical protein